MHEAPPGAPGEQSASSPSRSLRKPWTRWAAPVQPYIANRCGVPDCPRPMRCAGVCEPHTIAGGSPSCVRCHSRWLPPASRKAGRPGRRPLGAGGGHRLAPPRGAAEPVTGRLPLGRRECGGSGHAGGRRASAGLLLTRARHTPGHNARRDSAEPSPAPSGVSSSEEAHVVDWKMRLVLSPEVLGGSPSSGVPACPSRLSSICWLGAGLSSTGWTTTRSWCRKTFRHA